jgi:hypothetical protein
MHADDCSTLSLPDPGAAAASGSVAGSLMHEDAANTGIRPEPALPAHEAVTSEELEPEAEFALREGEPGGAHARSLLCAAGRSRPRRWPGAVGPKV